MGISLPAWGREFHAKMIHNGSRKCEAFAAGAEREFSWLPRRKSEEAKF
jgi:hypothetical protein